MHKRIHKSLYGNKKYVRRILILASVLLVTVSGSMVQEIFAKSNTRLQKVEEDGRRFNIDPILKSDDTAEKQEPAAEPDGPEEEEPAAEPDSGAQEKGAVKEPHAGKAKKAAASGIWKSRNQKTFYYNNGKKVTGLKEIEKKFYYFASSGVQRTGWQKHAGNYYFFKIANGSKGYMEKSKTVNGITLSADGKAVLTAASTAKLNVLVKANKIVEKAAEPEMEKPEKLKKCFAYILEHYQYRGSPVFEKSSCWELDYALDLFDDGHGSCYAFGAAFAFLANAVGYKNCYAVSSGGHGWAEINGKVYDPTWSLIDKKHSYYAISFSLSGIDGRPNYKRARKYVVKI